MFAGFASVNRSGTNCSGFLQMLALLVQIEVCYICSSKTFTILKIVQRCIANLTAYNSRIDLATFDYVD